MSAGLFAAKLALGPVLLPQARWLKRTALRLPEPQGPREGKVVVSVLGVNDVSSQLSARRFTQQTQLLWDEVRLRTGARWAVVCGLPPMHMLHAVPYHLRWYLGRYATMLDTAIAEWAHRERLGFCGLRWASDPADLAADGFHPGPGLYPQWSRRLADLICQRADHWMQRA